MTRAKHLLWIASLGLSMATSAVSFAQPTKVALTIDGDSSSIGLRRAVVGALDHSDLQVVSAKKTTKVIEQLGIGEVSSARDASTVAKKLAVNTVIQGAFDESDHTVTFTVFTKGKKSTFTLEVEDAKSQRFRKAVRKKMLSKVAVADSDDTNDDADEDKPAKASKKVADSEKSTKAGEKAKTRDKSKKHDDEETSAEAKDEPKAKAKKHDDEEDNAAAKDEPMPKAKKHGDEEAKDEPKAKAKKHDDEEAKNEPKTKAKKHDDEEANDDADSDKEAKHDRHAKAVASSDEDAGDDTDADEPPGGVHAHVDAPSSTSDAHGANLAAIRVDLGASMAGRSLKFQSTAIEGAPPSYRGKPVPGGHVAAELYPAAMSDRTSLIAGLGIAGDIDQTTSFTVPGADGTTPLKVKERHYSVGARFRIAFGHRPTSPTLTVGVGYGARTFAVDRSSGMTVDLPDVDYRMIDPGLAVRVPVGRRLALTAGGGGLLLMSAGAIANSDQYGRAHVLGGTATAGFEVLINNHLAVRVAAEGTQLDLKFYGTGMLATSRDGDPTTVDVQRAVDRYYGGEATLAVIY